MKAYFKAFLWIVQAVILVAAVIFLNTFFIYRAIVRTFSFFVCICVLYMGQTHAYKALYLFFISFFPTLGCTFFFSNCLNNRRFNFQNKSCNTVKKQTAKTAAYINKTFLSNVCAAKNLQYYADGKAYFSALFDSIKRSKKFVLLQYFIIKRGCLQIELFELLKEKAKQGVKVYLLYDALGCRAFGLKIEKFAKQNGIIVKSFNPASWLLSGRINNRLHGKIAVIDGKIGFIGGVNVGDEYVNAQSEFGRWKDGGVSFGGVAVGELIKAFNDNFKKINIPFDKRKSRVKSDEFIAVFSSKPVSGASAAAEVFITALYNAKKSVTACTPYLVPDENVKNALVSAVKRSVRVKIIIPEIPDKKTVYKVTKTYARELISNGVKVYFYNGGFIHAKHTVIDGKYVITGSTNLDYRSMYLHYETSAFIKSAALGQAIEEDITRNIKRYKATDGITGRFLGGILKIFAPLI